MASASSSLRVALEIDGGFAHVPGLARPIELDAARLGGEPAAQMRRLCAAACAEARERGARKKAPIPDGRRYRLTIDIDGSRREVTAADPVAAPAVAELIAFVEAHRELGG